MTKLFKSQKIAEKMKTIEDHDTFLNRINKSLYYSKLPTTDRLSLPVTEFAAELFSEVKNGCSLERLDVDEASRISRNACVSPCSFVLALLYLERLKDCNPEYLYKVAPSELFLVSLMVASKFLNDDGEEDEVINGQWAASGNITSTQMNRIEKEFLHAINWSIYVHDEEFWNRLKKLEECIAYKEARKRGWFSYAELSCLMKIIDLTALVRTVLSISSICVLTYAAGIMTLLGSALITSHIPGTSLAPKQHLIQSDDTINMRLTSSEISLEDNEYLLVTDVQNNLTCNTCNWEKPTSLSENISWQWLSTMMTWIPKYPELYDDIYTRSKVKKEVIQNLTPFITNSQISLRDRFEWENIVLQINWHDMEINLKYPQGNWKYYVDYITKISVGHQH
ncbi:protein CNPPD1 [Chelonus insularis]|uniref:protein CNPPD1 n=1 Tax=Chelonus insularis TaxID=460826 RepID=UPI00158B3125|nr:protein CNPPD1 [Chelonus insularis]